MSDLSLALDPVVIEKLFLDNLSAERRAKESDAEREVMTST
jgi:hypothetical protein